MRQPRSVTMDNGAQRWHAAPHRQAIVKIFHHMPLPHIVIWPTAIKTTRGRPSWPLWKQCTQFQQTNISLNPQLENIPTRSTIAAWSSLLMLLNANPPCLLRGQSKYFGKCQDARGVPCLYAYGAPFRHLLYPAYQCIPLYTNVYQCILCYIAHTSQLLTWMPTRTLPAPIACVAVVDSKRLCFHANVYWVHEYVRRF